MNRRHPIRSFFGWIITITILVFAVQYVLSEVVPFRYTAAVTQYSKQYQVNPYLVMGVMKAESNFNEQAVSKSGAKGLMQITDSTAQYCAKKIGMSSESAENIFDPGINIELGCYYISYLLERFDGEVETALAAYNAGEGNVEGWLADSRYSDDGRTLKAVPFGETDSYTKKIAIYANVYKALSDWVYRKPISEL